MIVEAYEGPTHLGALDEDILSAGLVPPKYNRLVGQIFEEWVENNYGVTRDPVPIVASEMFDQDVWPDGFKGDTLVEIKAISEVRGPNSSEKEQMERYGVILNNQIEWLKPTKNGPKSIRFKSVLYQFNNEDVAEAWLETIRKLISQDAEQIGEQVRGGTNQ